MEWQFQKGAITDSLSFVSFGMLSNNELIAPRFTSLQDKGPELAREIIAFLSPILEEKIPEFDSTYCRMLDAELYYGNSVQKPKHIFT